MFPARSIGIRREESVTWELLFTSKLSDENSLNRSGIDRKPSQWSSKTKNPHQITPSDSNFTERRRNLRRTWKGKPGPVAWTDWGRRPETGPRRVQRVPFSVTDSGECDSDRASCWTPPSCNAREASEEREAPRTGCSKVGPLEIPKIEQENVAPKVSAIFGVSWGRERERAGEGRRAN